jgi:hypothetical protein
MSFGFGFSLPAHPCFRGAWTPAQISTALWLDAADASTITLNGSTVSQWRDKSGNGRNFSQAAAGLQPTYAMTGWVASPAIIFDGVDDDLTAGSNWTGAGWSWYIVAQRTGAGVTQTLIGSVGIQDYFPISATSITSVNLFRSGGINDPATLSSYFSGAMIKDKNASPTMSRGTFWTRSATKFILAVCGANAFLAAPRLAKTVNYIHGGPMVEIVATPNDSTKAERELLEGYLAWKWGGF